MEKLGILLVDSSVVARMSILETVNSTEHGIVEHAASNGDIALEWLKQCRIDVVLMDSSIVRSEGIRLIERIRKDYPEVEIVLMSGEHRESPAIVLESLRAGAIDFIQKPAESELGNRKKELGKHLDSIFSQIILKKFSKFAQNRDPLGYGEPNAGNGAVQPSSGKHSDKGATRSGIKGGIDLILVASSTGGPVALGTVFGALPPGTYCPILIVQHMPPEFTNQMAQTLSRKYSWNIVEGKEGETVADGKIILAPGGRHLTLEAAEGGERTVRLLDTGYVNGVKPSADVLFRSVADVCKGRNVLAVILTGMGNDGTQGVVELKKNCNCYCITQSERTCVVYGMPKCVYEAGLSDEVADLKDIACRVHQIVFERGGGKPSGECDHL